MYLLKLRCPVCTLNKPVSVLFFYKQKIGLILVRYLSGYACKRLVLAIELCRTRHKWRLYIKHGEPSEHFTEHSFNVLAKLQYIDISFYDVYVTSKDAKHLLQQSTNMAFHFPLLAPLTFY